MNTRKLLLTSLLAAATLSVPAYAWTTGADGLPDTSGISSSTETEIDDVHNVSADTVYDFTDTSETENNPVTVTVSNGADVKLNAKTAGTMMAIGSISGTGDVWFARGRWRYNAASTFTSTGTIYMQGGQFWVTGQAFTTSNDVVLGSSTFSEGISSLDNAALRVGSNVTFNGTTTVVENAKIGFQGSSTLTIATLSGNGNITTGRYDGTNNFVVASANDFTGNISIVDGVSLTWSSSTATFGGLSGNGTVAAGSKLNIAKAGSDSTTFTGTVGASGNGVALALTGSGTQAFTGTSYFSSVSVGSEATLDLSGGTIALAGAIQNSGTVTLSDTTVFALDNFTASDGVYSLITNSGSGSVATASGVSFTRGGATIASSRVEVSTTDGYSVTFAGNYDDLVWAGTDGATWSIGDDKNWTSAAAGSEPIAFVNGDSVTFNIADASVRVSGTVNPAAMTVSANTTFTGTDATISIAKDSLTISGSATLGIDSGVTLDLGSGSDAIGASDAKLNLSGSGTVKYVFTGTSGTNSGVFIADTFTGTLDYYGNLNWSQWGGNSPISFSDSVTVRLSKAEGQTSAGFWGGAGRTFKNDFIFGSDYEINLGGGNLTFEGSVTASGSTLSITGSGSKTLTLSGTANIGSLENKSTATIKIGAGSGDTKVIAINRFNVGDVDSSTENSLNIKSDAVLKITGSTDKYAGNPDTYDTVSLLLGEWNSKTIATVEGKLLAQNASALAGDTGYEMTVADGGVLAVKGLGQAKNTASHVKLTLSDGGTAIFGSAGISLQNATNWSSSLGAGTIGTSFARGTTIATSLTLASAAGTTFDTQLWNFADDGNDITRSESTASSITVSGAISGNGKLIKTGAGTLFVTSNANEISGTVTVAEGTVIVGANNASGGGAVARLSSAEAPASIVVESGAAFKTHLGGGAPQNDGTVVATSSEEFAGNFYLKDGATLGNIDGHVALTGDIVFGATDMTGSYSESSTVTLTQYWQKTVELAGVLSGAGTVKLTSPGNQDTAFYKISGDENTFSGTYKLENATNKTSTLVLSSQNAAKDAKVNLSTSGARIFLGAANVTIAGLEGVSGSTIRLTTESGAPSASTLTVNQASDTTFAGTIAVGVALVKTGAGTLSLSGDNSANTNGVTISGGKLIAAHARALGTGKTTVESGAELGLVAETTVTVTNGIDLASGAKLVVDMAGVVAGTEENIVLRLVSETALNYNGTGSFDTTGMLGSVVVLENLNETLSAWTQSLSYADNTLLLTLTIPEPSVFGLLAGLGALALAGTRRRRKKA